MSQILSTIRGYEPAKAKQACIAKQVGMMQLRVCWRGPLLMLSCSETFDQSSPTSVPFGWPCGSVSKFINLNQACPYGILELFQLELFIVRFNRDAADCVWEDLNKTGIDCFGGVLEVTNMQSCLAMMPKFGNGCWAEKHHYMGKCINTRLGKGFCWKET